MKLRNITLLLLMLACLVCTSLSEAQSQANDKTVAQSSDLFMGLGPFIFGTPLKTYDRTHWKHFKGAFEHMYFPREFPKTLGKGKLESLLVVFVNNVLTDLEAQIAGTANIEAVKDHLSIRLGKPVVKKSGLYQDLVWNKGKAEIILRKTPDDQAIVMWLQ